MTEKTGDEGEIHVSVDFETTGGVPGVHGIHQIGACVVGRPEIRFKADLLIPADMAIEVDALTATGYSLEDIRQKGKDPQEMMNAFTFWVGSTVPQRLGVPYKGFRPIFLALNAAFDWMFFVHYQARYRVSNPFGYDPRDLKSMIADYLECPWREAKKSRLPEHLRSTLAGREHDGEYDALVQAEIFTKIRNALAARRQGGGGFA